MKIQALRLFVLAALLLVVGAGVATADDLLPPTWRGATGTTYGVWEFLTSDAVTVPDVGYNPIGTPTTEVTSPHPWFETYGGRRGVWELSGITVTKIPNYPAANPYKDIWVQVTWSPFSAYAKPSVDEVIYGVSGSLVKRTQLESSDGIQWYHDVYTMRITPNPPSEIVTVQGAIYMDQLVIDTICVPEPASVLALIIGCTGLVGLVRRRRP